MYYIVQIFEAELSYIPMRGCRAQERCNIGLAKRENTLSEFFEAPLDHLNGFVRCFEGKEFLGNIRTEAFLRVVYKYPGIEILLPVRDCSREILLNFCDCF